MLKNLFAALFQREKKTMPDPARTEQRLQQPRASTPATRSVSPSQHSRTDDSLSNPAHPLSPLNPLHPLHSSGYEPASSNRCDDNHRSISDYSSSCSSSSSDSGSSCSSSCD